VRKTVLSTVVISGILLAATASLAASDYYIRFDGRGETIELQSWSFGASGTSGLAPEVRTVTFAVPEPGDASTAQLARLCASGKPIRSAVLNGPDGRYQMNDVVVSSCAVIGNERRYELKGHVTLMK
jgi:hypothetical protein